MNQDTYGLCNSWNHLLRFCECVGKRRTNLEEKCVHCDKYPIPMDHNCFDKSEYYCYNPIACPFSKKRSRRCVLGRVICPLKNINACRWIGQFQHIWGHCQRFHRQNCFYEQAIITSDAHLAEIETFDYYTSNFLINSHGRLFRGSFEMHSNGTHRWCVSLLQIENYFESEYFVFRLQFRPANKILYEIPLMSKCLSNHETLFQYPNKEITMPKDLLRRYYNDQEKFFYRIFIDRYVDVRKYILPEDMFREAQLVESRFWQNSKRLEESNYDEYCTCVQDINRYE